VRHARDQGRQKKVPRTQKKKKQKKIQKLQMIKCVTPVTKAALHSIVSGLNFSILQVFFKKKSTRTTNKK